MFGKRGSLSVEAVMIVPFILITLALFILIWLNFFRYHYGVVMTHQSYLTDEAIEPISISIKWQDFEADLYYNYEPSTISSREVQNTVEYLFYLYLSYKERLKT